VLFGQLGLSWTESGYVFVTAEGRPYHPNYFTKRLQYLIKQAGLPPVRLHDLRHGVAPIGYDWADSRECSFERMRLLR
jgi:integrase